MYVRTDCMSSPYITPGMSYELLSIEVLGVGHAVGIIRDDAGDRIVIGIEKYCGHLGGERLWEVIPSPDYPEEEVK